MSVSVAFLILMIVAIIIGATLGRKDNKIKNLEEENKLLRRGINLAARIIGTSNVLNVSPKDLPEDFDK